MTDRESRLHEARIRQLADYLPHLFYPEEIPFEIQVHASPDPVPFADLNRCELRKMTEGQTWGQAWSSAWFRFRSTVPAAWRGRRVVARLQLGGEACVFAADGEPLQGITNGSIFGFDVARERFPLFAPAKGGERVDLWGEAGANGLFGIHLDQHPVPNKPHSARYSAAIECARLSIFDDAVWQCWLDFTFLHKLMLSLPVRTPHRAQLLHALSKAVDLFRHDRPNPADVRAVLAPHLARHADETQLTTTAVGHAHIDTAWLWPLRETVRKCARTFSSQLRLIEEYPGYVFGASQAQLYQFVKDRYPGLYGQVKKAIKAGRWEVQGAMWVEADTNVPSGESLVRQMLYGKRFFRREFGVEVTNLWLPDVFGYSASLPQLLKLAGVHTFLTQKISWSQFNRFPHHTFRWRGIDGSEIPTHFPPEDTYNSVLDPARLRYAQENFEERGYLPEFMTLFGVGDGGGGPREENLEYGRRQANMADCPKVVFGAAQPCLDRFAKLAEQLPVWSGELYLELHRGTLTTQARNKMMNRFCELALRRAEMLNACLPMKDYPGAEFERLWRTVLLNQFHDIIPGSSINWVYRESQEQYREVFAAADELTARAARKLARPRQPRDTFTVVNTLSHDFHGVVHVPASAASAVTAADGTPQRTQPAADGGVWIEATLPGLAACSLTPTTIGDDLTASAAGVRATAGFLENSLVRYEFGKNGLLTRILDKETGAEFMRPAETGNLLSLYEDWPHCYDAWEIDPTYEQQRLGNAVLKTCRVQERGPLVAALRLDWTIGQSNLTQVARLSAFSRRLDFVTKVNWRECRKMLRVSFPVDVEADEATYEIQFGLVRRPARRNTTWDMARFEVCAHRFADLSDQQRGVALLNNCKYGHKVHERTLDLNLLRSPYYPDPEADRGVQEFTYSLLPHAGRLEDSTVLAEAHALNQPPLVLPGAVAFAPPCRLATPGCVIDTIKKAEDEPAWIVRLYEPLGRRVQCEVLLAEPKARVFTTGLLEDAGQACRVRDGRVRLDFRPFEVKTLKILQ